MEITNFLTFKYQLTSHTVLVTLVAVTIKYYGKKWENIPFSQKIRKNIEWRHNGCFWCFQVRHSHVFIFCWICIQLTHSYFPLITLYVFANKHIRFVTYMAAENNGKPLKTKFEKIEKQNVGSCWFGSADNEYDRI